MLKKEIEFCFIGILSKDNLALIKSYDIEDSINILGYIEHRECVKYLLASDVLFLMISRGENDDAAMPGKVGKSSQPR